VIIPDESIIENIIDGQRLMLEAWRISDGRRRKL
jgi:hypothetical protein